MKTIGRFRQSLTESQFRALKGGACVYVERHGVVAKVAISKAIGDGFNISAPVDARIVDIYEASRWDGKEERAAVQILFSEMFYM